MRLPDLDPRFPVAGGVEGNADLDGCRHGGPNGSSCSW